MSHRWWALDANIVIAAIREHDERRAFAALQDRFGRRLCLPGTVAAELLAGARHDLLRRLTRQLLDRFALERPVLVPSAPSFVEQGRVLAALAEARGGPSPGTWSAIANDVLIAVTCREHDATLVTANRRDFLPIQRQLRGFRVVEPT